MTPWYHPRRQVTTRTTEDHQHMPHPAGMCWTIPRHARVNTDHCVTPPPAVACRPPQHAPQHQMSEVNMSPPPGSMSAADTRPGGEQ